MPERLVRPYGGKLVDLQVPPDALEELSAYAATLPSLQISNRSAYDLELIACGAFSPLDQFMGKDDYQRVLDEMRLQSGLIFPIPVALPVEPDERLKLDEEIALRSVKNELIAVLTIQEIYAWDREEVSGKVFETQSLRHPLIAEMHTWGSLHVSGPMRLLRTPIHYDFRELRLTPSQVRERLKLFGHQNVVAFQTRNPIHRAHEEITRRAAEENDAVLLLHPVVGLTKPGDISHYTRVRTYKALSAHYFDPKRILLALLPLAMRLAGPREALWHALIRRNFGANHLIVGRDHAGPGLDENGDPFYEPYAAQELVEQFSDELGVTMVPFKAMVYLPDEDRYEEISRIRSGVKTASISGTEVREDYLNNGRNLPAWFTRPEIAGILEDVYPPRHKQGLCLWFTGLSGAGKSTTAEIVTTLLQERGRQITLLDGDVVRTHLSKGLGFSKEDRDINIRRIGFVASEIVRHGGLVICAAVSPYRAARNDVRNRIGSDHFVEIFVDTPLEVCEQRDVKGLYSKARRGEIKGFTGIDDPYEAPNNPEIHLDTVAHDAEENARSIVAHLLQKGFVKSEKEDEV
ncbi:MAG: bifunctional sulfate adenylyltransferase/adenylylsulfate kinase [Chloroflexi bacterium]|nr:bifunctional sulfate adenylyltransferase/adenylylsulfate kinase [Chloroflexota bacterium]